MRTTRRRWAAVALGASVLALGAPPALGAYYYLNGSGAFGSMAANSPSAWTGTYTSNFNFMRSGGGSQTVYMTVQIRLSSTYTWSSANQTTEFGKGYAQSSWQHRCYHTGPNASISARCEFRV